MEQFCNKINYNDTITEELRSVKEIFTRIQVICCVIGVIGNIFNIQTLQSPTLRTIPFMYIRSLAYFDLIALTMILFHFILVQFSKNILIMFYTTYIEAPIINTFLIAGLYCAFFLTLERYFRTTKLNHVQQNNYLLRESYLVAQTRGRILLMLALSFIIHFPMVFQRTLQLNENGEYMMVNNVELLCKEPQWSVYSYYKLGRECLRFLIVILMTILNFIIGIHLHHHQQHRSRLVRRHSPQTSDSSNGANAAAESESTVSIAPALRREEWNVLRSFSERRLTVLMIVICIIFLLGNIPQIIVMILQNESMENNYKFQLYRHCSNTLEVLNHCLNFYVFCIACAEYTRSFLRNYQCVRTLACKVPGIAAYLASRRSSSVAVNTGLGMVNRDYRSVESIPEKSRNAVFDPTPSSSPPKTAGTNIKGILLNGNSATRPKRSLTIANESAVEIDADSDHEVTSI